MGVGHQGGAEIVVIVLPWDGTSGSAIWAKGLSETGLVYGRGLADENWKRLKGLCFDDLSGEIGIKSRGTGT